MGTLKQALWMGWGIRHPETGIMDEEGDNLMMG
jgi:hypothetical protein